MIKDDLLKILKISDPFDNFTPVPNTKLWGWNGDSELLSTVVKEVKPKLLVEVGSWMGQSGVTFATGVKNLNLSCTVVCVDTWLGSVEHWTDLNLLSKMELVNGRPSFYNRFMTNIINSNVQDVVLPLSMPSLIAASYLKHYKLQADVIYIDGSHDQKDVFNDLEAYWDLLSPGGIMFGDDLPWDGVREAVNAFAAEKGTPLLQQGINWIFRKRL